MTQPPSSFRHAAGILAAAICISSASLTLSAATSAGVSSKVRSQIAANPADGPAILAANIRALPSSQRLRYASTAYAASLEGVPRNSDRVLDLFNAAVSAERRAVLSLMEVAHSAAPGRIVDITRIALQQAGGQGDYKGGNNSDSIIAKAIALAPDKRSALLALGTGGGTDAGYEGGLVAIVPVGVGALGVTINPANLGGGTVIEMDEEEVEEGDEAPGVPQPTPRPTPRPNPSPAR